MERLRKNEVIGMFAELVKGSDDGTDPVRGWCIPMGDGPDIKCVNGRAP